MRWAVLAEGPGGRPVRALGLGLCLLAWLSPGCRSPSSGVAGQASPPAARAPSASGSGQASILAPASSDPPSAGVGVAPDPAPAWETPPLKELPLPAPEGPYRGLEPLAGARPPRLTRAVAVRLETSTGPVTLEVYPQAAPRSAARFLELVESGYFDETPVFFCDPGFGAQLGVNWRPRYRALQVGFFDSPIVVGTREPGFNQERDGGASLTEASPAFLKGDPSLFRLRPGTWVFARSRRQEQMHQVFLNLVDNSQLAARGYSVFGRLVEGAESVIRWRQPGSVEMGLDPGRILREGEAYLESHARRPVMIRQARVLAR